MNGREYDLWKTAVPYTSPEREQAISDLEALNKVHDKKSEKLEALQKTVEFLMEEIYRLDEALEMIQNRRREIKAQYDL